MNVVVVRITSTCMLLSFLWSATLFSPPPASADAPLQTTEDLQRAVQEIERALANFVSLTEPQVLATITKVREFYARTRYANDFHQRKKLFAYVLATTCVTTVFGGEPQEWSKDCHELKLIDQENPFAVLLYTANLVRDVYIRKLPRNFYTFTGALHHLDRALKIAESHKKIQTIFPNVFVYPSYFYEVRAVVFATMGRVQQAYDDLARISPEEITPGLQNTFLTILGNPDFIIQEPLLNKAQERLREAKQLLTQRRYQA